MSTDTLTKPKNRIEIDLEMVHHPSHVTIYMTTDYNRFSMINGNRAINMRKITRIIKDIESGNDMLEDYPIQVKFNGKYLDILDGQHRFFIDQKLSRPVYYILVQEAKSMADIARINSNVEKWKSQNFIDCYINQGIEDYQQLQTFIDTYKINIGTSMLLLHTGQPGNEGSHRPLSEKFEKGKFTVLHWEEAVKVAEMCKMFSAFNHWTDRSFIIALYRIKKSGLIPVEDVVEAFNKNPDKLNKQLSQKAYIYNLEQIVNTGKQKRIVIIK